MMIPARLTSELSNTSSSARSRRRLPSMALCLLGLLGSVVACNGKIDENRDVGRARPATTEPVNGTGAGAPSAPTLSRNTGDDTDPSDVSASEQAQDDLDRASSASRSNAGGRRNDRDRDDRDDEEELADAGAIDAGEADAGEADADVIADAGEVDAGEADAGAAL
jgi:hypothetical protein